MIEPKEYWLEQLPTSMPVLECPRCAGITFTAERKQYGIVLACFKCPTFIGIFTQQAGTA